MNVFIWKYIDKLSDSYHSGGGLVVFADSVERAIELAEADGITKVDGAPDEVRAAYGDESVYKFDDAGCC